MTDNSTLWRTTYEQSSSQYYSFHMLLSHKAFDHSDSSQCNSPTQKLYSQPLSLVCLIQLDEQPLV